MPTRVLSGIIVAVPEPPLMTQLEFASRFTLAEQVALEMVMESSPDAELRATLRVIEKNLLRATGVDTKDLRTVLGAETCVDVLIAAEVVEASNRTQRLAEILA